MDSLDFNLHQAILKSLATSFSSGDAKSAVSTGKAAATAAESHSDSTSITQTNYQDILDTFDLTVEVLEEKNNWTLCDANAVIALSEYATEIARAAIAHKAQSHTQHADDTSDDTSKRLLECTAHIGIALKRLQTITVERCLGGQGIGAKWVIADQLACALVTAAITLVAAQDSNTLSETIFRTYKGLKDKIEISEVSHVVEHILPCLHGIHRAITSAPAEWSVKDAENVHMMLEPLSSDALSTISSISRGSFIHSSLQGRFVLSVLARYEMSGSPLSINFVTKCDTDICQAILVGSIMPATMLSPEQNWQQITSGSIKVIADVGLQMPHLSELATYAKRTIAGSLEVLRDLEDEQDSTLEGTDLYELNTISNCLKIATVACLAHMHDAQHIATVETFLSDASPLYDSGVQITALECVQALVHSYADLAEPMLSVLRRFITSPLPILSSSYNNEPSPVLQKAGDALATCIGRLNQNDMTLSTIYSLLNYLPSAKSENTTASIRTAAHISDGARTHPSFANRTPEERHTISSNTLFVVTTLATRFHDKEIIKLALSMLLQRIRNSDVVSERSALMCVAELAPHAGKDEFTEAIAAFSETARYVARPDLGSQSGIILAASLKLAGNLEDRPEYAILFLRELLVLFVDQSSPARHGMHKDGHIREKVESATPADRASVLPHLLNTLSIIEMVMSSPRIELQKGAADEELVVLFRNLWFISTVLGFTMSNTRDARQHKAILRSIAFKTPCLLQGTQGNYVETELEYNPFIRKEHGQSSEALRNELESIIRANPSLSPRSLSYPQVVFLLSVAKLECMRAELGDPSVMLHYFRNEGVNRGPLLGPLNDISGKVTEAFITSFDHKVRRHAVKRSIAEDLKSMVLECCSTSAKGRQAALKSLDAIFAAFPVLLCDSNFLVTMLESLTILRNACESEMDDEYNATFEFESKRADLKLVLPDDYAVRNEILNTLHQYVRAWLSAALAASPLEMVGLLQDYLDSDATCELSDNSGMGKSVALDIAKMMPSSIRQAEYPAYGGWKADTSSLFSSAFGTRHTYGSEAKTVVGLSHQDGHVDKLHVQALRKQLRQISDDLRHRKSKLSIDELRPLLYRAAAVVLAKKEIDYGLIREIVFIPVHAINPPAMHLGVEVWAWLVDRRADVEAKLMVDVHLAWSWTIRRRRGMFSVLLKTEDPINSKTEFAPTDVAAMKKANRTVRNILAPHRYLIEFLSSRFQAYRYRDRYLVLGCMRTVIRACERCRTWGKHPLVRELRMKILTLGFSILNSTHLEQTLEGTFRDRLYRAALSWFEEAPSWSYGADRLQLTEDIKAMKRLISMAQLDQRYPSAVLSSRPEVTQRQPAGPTALDVRHQDLRKLLLLHLESEIQRISVWSNPIEEPRRGADPASPTGRSMTATTWTQSVRSAWKHSPRLAVLMAGRFKDSAVSDEIASLVRQDPGKAADVPEALDYFLGSSVGTKTRSQLRHLIYWAPVSPIAALRYFLPAFNTESLVVQYAMRTLEQHPIDLVFFYIPQVVQALRTDPLSYMERFIFETSKISQLFCHQMIWNMKANFYRDDLAEQADPDKETFERMVDLIVTSLSGDAQAFYEKEFGFFNEVTSISRKLMPFVKKTKAEKKAKIDEEMAKIKVEEGVYLPSHPEGRVIDIDRHSGRPLQSHAKTPFMATFKVTREVEQDYSEAAIEEAGGEHTRDGGKDGGANEGFPSLQGGDSGQPRRQAVETKLSAIFKVGDDCRQDVLALQVIAQFKNMFNVYGLDLQLQPYKVLATGPGTGIIDVVPNATSRDEMGRAKINDLTEFFLFQFGPAEGVAFQRARSNFIQSMAAYSVLCYILQIKDRHNGNIMIDGEGRITHIDFGFLFDIGPGGIKFEPNSFKLTHEMITLMGGKNSQGYRQFRELTVKAFLACRPYVEDVLSTCSLMMPTQLPSFKGEGTMIRLRDRFKPDLTEREAARYMIGVIENACENSMSIVYDQFQYYQNRIPYAS